MRPGRARFHSFHRLSLGTRNLHDPVAEIGYQTLQVQRDQRLVLNDHDIGRDLARDLAPSFVDQPLQRRRLQIHHHGGILGGEFLYRHQQESLTGGRSQDFKIAPGGLQDGCCALTVLSLFQDTELKILRKVW